MSTKNCATEIKNNNVETLKKHSFFIGITTSLTSFNIVNENTNDSSHWHWPDAIKGIHMSPRGGAEHF